MSRPRVHPGRCHRRASPLNQCSCGLDPHSHTRFSTHPRTRSHPRTHFFPYPRVRPSFQLPSSCIRIPSRCSPMFAYPPTALPQPHWHPGPIPFCINLHMPAPGLNPSRVCIPGVHMFIPAPCTGMHASVHVSSTRGMHAL
eukprot:293327-Chlamydomonas_euryale.AAC.1